MLDWLEIGRRHRVPGNDLRGLVLLDLPDFDSVEVAHRLEVDRIVELADLLLWVVEPQKYADAALHDGYLRRLATHGDAMALVLNQADLLGAKEVALWRDDAERLLEDDGLGDTPALVVSAQTGAGLEGLHGSWSVASPPGTRPSRVSQRMSQPPPMLCAGGAATRARRR